VDVFEAGTYDIFLRYATMYAAPRRMEVNGEVVKGLESFSMPLTGGWQNWVDQKLTAPVTLKAKHNVIRMTSLGGGGLNLAGIRLEKALGTDGWLVSHIDAASFTAQGGGRVQAYGPSRHRSFHNWEEKGHWLEWTLRAPKDGDYDLTFHCASSEKSSREVRVNGEVAKGLESVALDPTGNWQMWRDVKLPAKVRLKKGDNTLRLTCLSGGLNLDEIRLAPAGS
jgi:hypothetical protein